MKVKIGGVTVGDGEPCFIIAEAGVNHNGDIRMAKKLVEAAAEAGADAVKFQTFQADRLVTPYTEKAEYQKVKEEELQYEMLKNLELKKDDFKDLARYAEKKSIMFLSSPFDRESVDLLAEIGVPAFKIASGEITNFPLLEYVAGKGKPLILSTGMATLGEIEEALTVVKRDKVILLHCVTSYPASIEEVNLRVMKTLSHAFGVPVGFSDHTIGITASLAAVALGACVVEKHFTLDRALPGPDHKASLEPDELKRMIASIRDVEKGLGDGIRRVTLREEEIKRVARKSIVAAVDIPEGTVLSEDMLDTKRPGTGIEPKHLRLVVGRKAARPIKSGELITFETLR